MMTTALIGVLTGIASAMLFASVLTGSALGVMVLFFLSPLPVAIAGIGWSSRAAVVAVAVASTTIVVLSRGRLAGAGFYLLALGLPAVVLSHLLLLAKPAAATTTRDDTNAPSGQPALEWYPLGPIVAFAGVWAGVLAALATLLIYADIETVTPALRKAIEQVAAQGTPLPGSKRAAAGAAASATPQQIDSMVRVMLALIPAMMAAMWFVIALANLWLAGATSFAAGRLKRPWPDLATIALPPWLPGLLAAALAASFIDGAIGRSAGAIAAGCFAVTTVTGFAILHFLTRGHPLRPFILMAAYVSLAVVLPIAVVGISLLALAEPILRWNRRGPSAGGTTGPADPPASGSQ